MDELFPLGKIVITPGALAEIRGSDQTPEEFIDRHASGDWGKLDWLNQQCNEKGVLGAARSIASRYETENGDSIWIVTAPDRSTTTVLLASERIPGVLGGV